MWDPLGAKACLPQLLKPRLKAFLDSDGADNEAG